MDAPTQPTSPAPAPSSSAPASQSLPSSAPAPQSAPTPASPTPAPAAAEWARPSYFPETVKTETDAETFVREHIAFRASEESRKLTLPKAPEEYPFELPQDFKPPQGVEFKLDDKDPLLPQARAFALKHGLSADGFREMLGLYAAGQVGNQQLVDNAKASEVGKLGVNGPARKTAVDTWLNANLGEDLGKHLSGYLLTAKAVEAIEKLMARDRGSAGSFSHAHREAPADAGTIPGYANMSFEQRRAAQEALRSRSNAR